MLHKTEQLFKALKRNIRFISKKECWIRELGSVVCLRGHVWLKRVIGLKNLRAEKISKSLYYGTI